MSKPKAQNVAAAAADIVSVVDMMRAKDSDDRWSTRDLAFHYAQELR